MAVSRWWISGMMVDQYSHCQLVNGELLAVHKGGEILTNEDG